MAGQPTRLVVHSAWRTFRRVSGERRDVRCNPTGVAERRAAQSERSHGSGKALSDQGQIGSSDGAARGHVLACRDNRCGSGSSVWSQCGSGARARRGVLQADDGASFRAELADAHERGPAAGSAFCVLCATGRGCAVEWPQRHLRHASVDGAYSSVWGRHRASPSRGCAARGPWCALRRALLPALCRS